MAPKQNTRDRMDDILLRLHKEEKLTNEHLFWVKEINLLDPETEEDQAVPHIIVGRDLASKLRSGRYKFEYIGPNKTPGHDRRKQYVSNPIEKQEAAIRELKGEDKPAKKVAASREKGTSLDDLSV